MRGIIVCLWALVLMCGCERHASIDKSPKWEFEELKWDVAKEEGLYGYTNVHAILKTSADSESWRRQIVYDRPSTLSILGEMGWDVVWVSPSGDNFLLRRPKGTPGRFTFSVEVDYAASEKATEEEMAAKEKAWRETQKRTDEILHPHDDTEKEIQQIIDANAAADEQAKLAESKRVKQGQANTIKWLQDLADKGDVYGELRLGERYLKGDGVEKDLAKAKELLQKAAAQGNEDAREILQKLPPQESARKD